MSLIVTALIAFVSIIVPGFFLALALLKKTKLNMFEITVIGFIFGLIFPPTLTWLESYLINYIHAFSFSARLYRANVVVLTLVRDRALLPAGGDKPRFPQAQPSAKPKATVAACQVHKDYRERLTELRSHDRLPKHGHAPDEGAREGGGGPQQGSTRSRTLPDAGPRSGQIAEMHRAEEKRLMESHEREERLLLDGQASPTQEGEGRNSLIWYRPAGADADHVRDEDAEHRHHAQVLRVRPVLRHAEH